MYQSRDGVEAALYLALVLLDRKGLGKRFQAVLEAAAESCTSDAEEDHRMDNALREMATSLMRASSRRRPRPAHYPDPTFA